MLQQKLSSLRRWLHVTSPATVPKKHKNRFEKAYVWIVESDQYVRWWNKPSSTSWLHGQLKVAKGRCCTAILEGLLQRCNPSSGGVSAQYDFDFAFEGNYTFASHFIIRSVNGVYCAPSSVNYRNITLECHRVLGRCLLSATAGSYE